MSKKILEQDIPIINKMIKNILGADGYKHIKRLGGLTDHTYRVTLDNNKDYIFRIPGEGTEDLINRVNEGISSKLACKLGIDTNIIYFGTDGIKISDYIPNAVTMSSESLISDRHIRQIANILNKLHTCGEDTGVPFEVFNMAANYEKIIKELNVPMFSDYHERKLEVIKIKSEISHLANICNVPCHNDPLCENWVEGNGRMYLIDWEYAGMNDGMWDVADVSIEAGFNEERDKFLLRNYLLREPSETDIKHFLANKIFVDYLWTLWAKARVPYDGQPMEDWASERYTRMSNNIKAFKLL